jgi:glycosyltransferase involved in cell wall biosynthesis
MRFDRSDAIVEPVAVSASDRVSPEARSPSVSVVIPTRDRPELLRRAVTAVMSQRYEGSIECIVVFDRTEPILPDVPIPSGRRLTGVRNTRTPGLAGARNTGVLMASGDLLASCDDDDEWFPDKLARQVERLALEPTAVVVCTGIELRASGRTIRRVPSAERISLRDLLRSRHMELHSSNILVRRADSVESIGLIDEQLPEGQNEDYEWLLRAARMGPIAVVRDVLVRVDWQPRSWFSERWETMIAAHMYLLERHPELRQEPKGLARILGQIAFYHAAAGDRRSAMRWSARSLRANWLERRAYLSLAVSARLVSAHRVVGWANRLGKGI